MKEHMNAVAGDQLRFGLECPEVCAADGPVMVAGNQRLRTERGIRTEHLPQVGPDGVVRRAFNYAKESWHEVSFTRSGDAPSPERCAVPAGSSPGAQEVLRPVRWPWLVP